jgi:hypothetical protein
MLYFDLHTYSGILASEDSIRIIKAYFDEFGFAGLIERARFGFLPLDKAAKYSINRLIDSRNCFELIQRGFVIPSRSGSGNHEHIRTVEQIVSGEQRRHGNIPTNRVT